MNKTKNRRRRGFTLIEMIVVIAIIAVLIALVAPLMTRYITNAKELKYEASAKLLYSAGEAYVAEVMLNGYEDCVEKGNDYGTNELNTKGNGIFISNKSALSVRNVDLGAYLNRKIDGNWMVGVDNFEVAGVVVIKDGNAYVYPRGFKWDEWRAGHD